MPLFLYTTYIESYYNLSYLFLCCIIGYDFLSRSSAVTADAFTIDVTPPEITKESITITGRHLVNSSEISAW